MATITMITKPERPVKTFEFGTCADAVEEYNRMVAMHGLTSTPSSISLEVRDNSGVVCRQYAFNAKTGKMWTNDTTLDVSGDKIDVVGAPPSSEFRGSLPPLFRLTTINDSGFIQSQPDVFPDSLVDDRVEWARTNGYTVEETHAGVVIINPVRDTIWIYSIASR